MQDLFAAVVISAKKTCLTVREYHLLLGKNSRQMFLFDCEALWGHSRWVCWFFSSFLKMARILIMRLWINVQLQLLLLLSFSRYSNEFCDLTQLADNKYSMSSQHLNCNSVRTSNHSLLNPSLINNMFKDLLIVMNKEKKLSLNLYLTIK